MIEKSTSCLIAVAKIQIIFEIKNISGGNLRLFNISARNKASKSNNCITFIVFYIFVFWVIIQGLCTLE